MQIICICFLHLQALDARLLPAHALPADAVQGERGRHDAPSTRLSDRPILGSAECHQSAATPAADLGVVLGGRQSAEEVPIPRWGATGVHACQGHKGKS